LIFFTLQSGRTSVSLAVFSPEYPVFSILTSVLGIQKYSAGRASNSLTEIELELHHILILDCFGVLFVERAPQGTAMVQGTDGHEAIFIGHLLETS